jgi:hypothetical protein
MHAQEVGKVQLNIKRLAQSRNSVKYSNFTFLSWVIISCFCMYNYNTVCGKASHSNSQQVML